MKPHWKRTLILVLMLSVIGGGAYWLEYHLRPKKERKEEASKKPFVFDGVSISQITLSYGKDRSFTFSNISPGKWKIEKPILAQADSGNLGLLVSSLDRLMTEETISLKDESPEKKKELLKEYSLSKDDLEKPEAGRIEVILSSGKKIILRLGGLHPIGSKVFALLELNGKLNDEKVWLLPYSVRDSVEHYLSHWREKRVFDFERGAITRVSFSGKDSYEIIKRESAWVLKKKGSSEEIPGDSKKIDFFLSSMESLRIAAFVHDQEMKGARSVLKTTLTLQEGKTHSVEFFELKLPDAHQYKNASKIYFRVQGQNENYELEPSTWNYYHKSLDELKVKPKPGS